MVIYYLRCKITACREIRQIFFICHIGEKAVEIVHLQLQKKKKASYCFGFSRFGFVSAVADWQGLDAPFIVELFMVRLVSANPPNVSDSGWSVLPPPDSRRQRALIEPVELCTRLAMCGFGPNPAGGFAAKTFSLRTRH